MSHLTSVQEPRDSSSQVPPPRGEICEHAQIGPIDELNMTLQGWDWTSLFLKAPPGD